MTHETTKCCPQCGAGNSRLQHRTGKFERTDIKNPHHEYRCIKCNHTFDHPDEREKRHEGTITHGFADLVANTDPSEIGGDTA